MAGDPVRVFIGSGEASRLERKVLQYSLRKNSRRDLEVYVFNGTHNAVEPPKGEPFLAPMSLKAKYANVTEFSNYRFLIPRLCSYQGRAIYLDSDMVALRDIGELIDAPMGDADFLAKTEPYGSGTDGHHWGLSVMLIDCGRCKFDLEDYVRRIEQGMYQYSDMMWMTPKFLSFHPFKIGEIDPAWNVFDKYDAGTKLIHYTNLYTQPWKRARHPYGDLWFQYFAEAQKAGLISANDIEVSRARGYVRLDILEGNQPPRLKQLVRGVLRRLNLR